MLRLLLASLVVASASARGLRFGIVAQPKARCYLNPETIIISECECHESCGSCGYYDMPDKAEDCITCADGSAVVPVFEDGTGTCE
ncbi:hypothetical protein M885DRAFT_520547 [Pelagophyceae sp. CCMP2097]|nr:hypothetical protein M885DRAFT_520547 [Pelagophyceae sp. CCMP2097]